MTGIPASPARSSPKPRTKLRRRVDSSGAAPRSPARATSRRNTWEDDEGGRTEDDEILLRKAAAVPPPKRKRRAPAPTAPSAFSPTILLRPALRLLSFAVTPLCSWIITLLLPIALLALIIWLGVTTVRTALSTSLSAFLPAGMQTVVGVYCATIGVGCSKSTDERVIGAAARQATARAEQALDVFQSLLKMGGEDSQGLALHPVEAWELATAVKYSGLEERDFLSEQLNELGDRVRDLKDDVIGLNSLGLNSFVWIVHEFTRLEELIVRQRDNPNALTPEQLSSLISSLFEKINTSLASLLQALDRTIPTATRASDHSRLIFGAMKEEESNKQREKIELGWAQYLGGVAGAKGWKGQQLRRDLELTRESAASVVEIWKGLEGTRTSLLGYRSNVGHFKAGVIGFHISGIELSAEDEVRALRAIMGDFRSTLAEAKARGNRKPGQGMEDRTLPPVPVE